MFQMKEELLTLEKEALDKIQETEDLKALQEVQVAYTGRKGSITEVLRGMGKLSKEERPVIGELANKVRVTIQAAIDEKKAVLEEAALEEQLQKETIDVTLPGRPTQVGGSHVLTSIIEEIEDIFIGLGYEVREGPQGITEQCNDE